MNFSISQTRTCIITERFCVRSDLVWNGGLKWTFQ